ncbi:MAG: helix-turn-helix domain-containing protein [Candidatus Aenigmarchaeota archaeon]|nr:helix-turn-helix domain-containing protein [Candidatus Aenigmarchaeota archaeon]
MKKKYKKFDKATIENAIKYGYGKPSQIAKLLDTSIYNYYYHKSHHNITSERVNELLKERLSEELESHYGNHEAVWNALGISEQTLLRHIKKAEIDVNELKRRTLDEALLKYGWNIKKTAEYLSEISKARVYTGTVLLDVVELGLDPTGSFLMGALEINRFNLKKTAHEIGITLKTLEDKLRRYEIARWVHTRNKSRRQLGWEIKYYAGSMLLYKGPRDTEMTASIIAYPKGEENLIEYYIFDPEHRAIVDGRKSVSRYKLARELDRTLFGRIEAYLSGSTNVPKILRYYKKYKIQAND